jgi:hypothetical protein
MNKRIKKKLEKRDKRFHYAQYHEGRKLLKHIHNNCYGEYCEVSGGDAGV